MIYDENIAPKVNILKNNDMGKKSGRTIEQIYQKKTQLEHILLRPDTYVGSVERQTQPMWVYEKESNQMVHRPCSFVPGLYKIFDEIMVNAADNKQRDASMNKIDVTIDAEENLLRVWNNGQGIPIVMHQEHRIYVPELIFGHLLTGSNFDDNEAKTTGGRNGYGAKLANIFSLEFTVETFDAKEGLKYKQVFRKNMTERSEPEIKKVSSGSDFTCITFKPDLARFKMDIMDEDTVALLSKRVFDIAGTNTATGAKLSVFLNGKKIESKNFEQYIGIYRGLEPVCAFERVNERWEVGVGASDGSFQQVSFVNSICTIKGGQHVNYIADQITARLVSIVKKKNKGQEVKANHIKNHLAIYVNALIVNPAFDSQTKETLTTKVSAFGSTCPLSDKFLKQVEKSGVIESILSWAQFKQNAELKKKGGSKRAKLTGIVKLDDANYAGSSKSRDCTLILTEGDSAKALAISGLGVVGRDYYGVFPLKGKLLNVREASHAQIMKNEEVQNIAKILGLTFGKQYEDVSSLRYGHLMIMTDQDHDGSHIKGLLINFLHHFWPSLLHIPGFLQQFITPIVKCMKGHKEETFFTIPEYQNWREAHHDGKGWKIKYYKGLGTSTAAEAKEYFSNLQTHEINFVWDDLSDDVIDMAFSKKRVEDRKTWLLKLEPGTHIDYAVEEISYDKFVNHELILFSHADNQRSLPHFMDGFKPSQRKVLFACFKRNLKHEIKVAQLAGYISEHSAYHHGEASLTQTIIGMAQNFVGSNNINLLSPCGQFGTRLMGGKDAASPRYVFTKLEKITRCIFHPDDDALLEYLDDDGQSIEPVCYVPVIPMALVNGSEGIGTGWSTTVPTYNPRQIIANLKRMIRGEEVEEMHPWFRGFTGEIRSKTGKDYGNYSITGIIEEKEEGVVVISELPVKRWTTDYKQFLESVMIGAPAAAKEDGAAAAQPLAQFVKDFKENHTDTSVLFTVTIPAEKLTEALADKGGLVKKFKLEGSVATTNMHMFDSNGQIKRFESAMEIMKSFYEVRLNFYGKRRTHLIQKLTDEWEKLDNKVRFILMVIAGQLVVSNRKKKELLQDLKSKKFKTFSVAKKDSKTAEEGDSSSSSGSEEDDVDASGENLTEGYDYLLSMKLWSLTMERVKSLTEERDAKRLLLEDILSKTPEDLWIFDLDQLEVALDAFDGEFVESQRAEDAARRKAQKNAKSKKDGKTKSRLPKASKSKKARDLNSDDEDDDEDMSVSEAESGSDEDFEASEPVRKAAPTKKQTVAAPQKKVSQPLAAGSTVTAAAKASGSAAVSHPTKKTVTPAPSITATATTADLTAKLLQRMETSKPVAAAAAPAAKAKAKAPMEVFDLTDDVVEKPKKTVTKAKPVKTKSSKPSKAVELSDDDDDDEEEEDEEFTDIRTPPKLSKPTRLMKAKPTYKFDDDDEDEDDLDDIEDDEDSDGRSVEDCGGEVEEDESDFEEEIPKPKPKKVTKSNTAGNGNSAKEPTTVKAASKKVTTETAVKAVTTKAVGMKRLKKTALQEHKVVDDDDVDVFSEGPSTPQETKKPRTKAKAIAPVRAKALKQTDIFDFQTSSNSSNSPPEVPKKTTKKTGSQPAKSTNKPVEVVSLPLQPAKSAAPMAPVAEVTKPKSKPVSSLQSKTKPSGPKKRTADSDDDDEEVEEVDQIVVGIAKRSPKPARQRKQINYAMYDEDDDDELDQDSDSD